MRLEVPFFKQTNGLNCGPAVLRCVLAYFRKDLSIEELEKEMELKDGKGAHTIQLAWITSKLGLGVELYSKVIGMNEENDELEFYKKYKDESLDSDILSRKIKELGGRVEEKRFELNEILEKTDDRCLCVALIDWNVIKRKEGYQGHFVPIVGFDARNVVIHNVGLNDGSAFLEIDRVLFDRARKANGTDEDILFIRND